MSELQSAVVLTVDDDEPSRCVVTRRLQRAGYRVVEADTGVQALDLAARLAPDVVILSGHLPDLSGSEVARRLQSDPATGSIPILQLAATSVDAPARAAGLERGVDAYLCEPVTEHVLLAQVGTLLRVRRLHEELTRARELAENSNREIAHRMKNNLAMVAGLLQLQMMQQRDEGARAALADAMSRVMTFASIQQELQGGTSEGVDLVPVVRRIASAAGEALAPQGVVISVTGETAPVPQKAATNLAVIANELITNALKYGGPGAEGERHVELAVRESDGFLRLRVWNSGNPLAFGFDLEAQHGMGLLLVRELAVGQYGGAFALTPEKGGTVAEVAVPVEELRRG